MMYGKIKTGQYFWHNHCLAQRKEYGHQLQGCKTLHGFYFTIKFIDVSTPQDPYIDYELVTQEEINLLKAKSV